MRLPAAFECILVYCKLIEGKLIECSRKVFGGSDP